MIRSSQCQHLTTDQRTRIRRSLQSERHLAGVYGVSVATIRLVRDSAEQEHPARIAALHRREGTHLDLKVLGGATLPVPLDYWDR